MSMIMIVFFYARMITVYNKSDVDIFSTLKERAIDQDFKFTAQHGLFVAAALTEFNSETENIEDAKYGELTIEQFGWGYDV